MSFSDHVVAKAAIAAVAAYLVFDGVHGYVTRKWDEINTMTHVSAHVFISNWAMAVDESVLRERGIKRILCLNKSIKDPDVLAMYQRLGIEHMHVDAEDVPWQDLRPVFDRCYTFVQPKLVNRTVTNTSNEDQHHQNTLIHCFAGCSRSAAIVVMWLMRRNGWSFRQAYQSLKSRRPVVSINWGFQHQLRSGLGPSASAELGL